MDKGRRCCEQEGVIASKASVWKKHYHHHHRRSNNGMPAYMYGDPVKLYSHTFPLFPPNHRTINCRENIYHFLSGEVSSNPVDQNYQPGDINHRLQTTGQALLKAYTYTAKTKPAIVRKEKKKMPRPQIPPCPGPPPNKPLPPVPKQ